MRFEDRSDLLNPGYLPFESGIQRYEDGYVTVAALTRMPHCRAKMVHWWFGWLGGTEQYKLWHPTDHVFLETKGIENGNYYGASHLIEERLAGSEEIHKLRVDFQHPHEMFDAARFDATGAVAICGAPGSLERPVSIGHMCHYVRDTDYGAEMRSRFWLGDVRSTNPDKSLPPEAVAQIRGASFTDAFCRDLHQHAIEEMGYLADLLPVLYRQVTRDATC